MCLSLQKYVLFHYDYNKLVRSNKVRRDAELTIKTEVPYP